MAQEAVSSSGAHHQLLSSKYHILLDYMNTEELIPYFVTNRVLTIPEVSRVKDEKGFRDKNHCIISYLYLKPATILPLFIKSLRQGNHNHVANLLSAPPDTPFDTPFCTVPPNSNPHRDLHLCEEVCDKDSLDLRISVSAIKASARSLLSHGNTQSDAHTLVPSSTSDSRSVNTSSKELQRKTDSQNNDPSLDSTDLKRPHLSVMKDNSKQFACMGDGHCVEASRPDKSLQCQFRSSRFNSNTLFNDEIPFASSSCKRNGDSEATAVNLKADVDDCMDIDTQEAMHCKQFTESGLTGAQCILSPNCKCMSELEAEIFQAMEIAVKQLKMHTLQGNWGEVSYCKELINECFSWLKLLRDTGVVADDVREGCVLLNLKCESVEALDSLWYRWTTGELKTGLEQIFLPFFAWQYPRYQATFMISICSHQYLRYWRKLNAQKLRQDSPAIKTTSAVSKEYQLRLPEGVLLGPTGDAEIQLSVDTDHNGSPALSNVTIDDTIKKHSLTIKDFLDLYDDIVSTLDKWQQYSLVLNNPEVQKTVHIQLCSLLITHYCTLGEETTPKWRVTFNELYDYFEKTFGCEPDVSSLPESLSSTWDAAEMYDFAWSIMDRMEDAYETSCTKKTMPCLEKFTKKAPSVSGDNNPLLNATFWKDVLDHHVEEVLGCSLQLFMVKSKVAVMRSRKCASHLDVVTKMSNNLGKFSSGVLTGTLALAGIALMPVTYGASIALTAASMGFGLTHAGSKTDITQLLLKCGWTKADTMRARNCSNAVIKITKTFEEFLTICIHAFTQAREYLATEEGKMITALMMKITSFKDDIHTKALEAIAVDDVNLVKDLLGGDVRVNRTLAAVDFIMTGDFVDAGVQSAPANLTVTGATCVKDRFVNIIDHKGVLPVSSDHLELGLEIWDVVSGVESVPKGYEGGKEIRKFAGGVKTSTDKLLDIYHQLTN